MEHKKRFASVFSLFMSVLVGMIGYIKRIVQKDIFVRILVSLILFYILGLIAARVIKDISDSIAQKKLEDLEDKVKSEVGKNNNFT
jgi:divalent metal cation (Fe/Co/Zn/Cd) transporter